MSTKEGGNQMINVLHKRASLFAVSAVAMALVLSACGGGGSSGASQGANAPGEAPSSRAPVTPAASGGGGARIGTRSVPGIGTVLVNSSGLTLYHLSTDTSTKTTCTGGCAEIWPPLLTKNGHVPASPGVSGQFGELTRPDMGDQVTFNGMPLYTFTGDSKPGQVNGQGIDGFFAVTS
jgi:predicted lipoprotein with Yx(FWY)xxD motif